MARLPLRRDLKKIEEFSGFFSVEKKHCTFSLFVSVWRGGRWSLDPIVDGLWDHFLLLINATSLTVFSFSFLKQVQIQFFLS